MAFFRVENLDLALLFLVLVTVLAGIAITLTARVVLVATHQAQAHMTIHAAPLATA